MPHSQFHHTQSRNHCRLRGNKNPHSSPSLSKMHRFPTWTFTKWIKHSVLHTSNRTDPFTAITVQGGGGAGGIININLNNWFNDLLLFIRGNKKKTKILWFCDRDLVLNPILRGKKEERVPGRYEINPTLTNQIARTCYLLIVHIKVIRLTSKKIQNKRALINKHLVQTLKGRHYVQYTKLFAKGSGKSCKRDRYLISQGGGRGTRLFVISSANISQNESPFYAHNPYIHIIISVRRIANLWRWFFFLFATVQRK